jgi:hypothetical protein
MPSICRWLRFSLPVFAGLFMAAVSALPADRPEAKPAAAAAQDAPRKHAVFVRESAENVFRFETEEIQGSIQLDGAYHGVTRLVDRRTGKQVIDPRYSALNLFKLMSVNQVMGMPRTMDRKVQASSRWVEVKWPATEGHHGEVAARYEVREPNAVDLAVTVRSAGTYPGYEVFMSNYFDKGLRPHVYLQPAGRGPGEGEADLVLPRVNDVFRGTVLVFPRDWHAARRCLDGRWNRDERGTPTVQMCPVRCYAHCLAFMADLEKRLGVLLMSDPRQCYAISTRYHADEEKQRLTDYSAFDLSLFGDDLLPGDQRTARVRLALVTLDPQGSQPVKLYRAFLAELKKER